MPTAGSFTLHATSTTEIFLQPFLGETSKKTTQRQRSENQILRYRFSFTSKKKFPENTMGHDVFPEWYRMSFNSKLWKAKQHLRLEQALGVHWTSMHDEEGSPHADTRNLQARIMLPLTDSTFRKQASTDEILGLFSPSLHYSSNTISYCVCNYHQIQYKFLNLCCPLTNTACVDE